MIVDKLKKIVTTLGGSYSAKDDTVTELLEQLNTAFANGGGSGGGSGLPTVTTDDNGKLLGVTAGAWGKVDAPSGGAYDVPITVPVLEGGDPTTTAVFADVVAAARERRIIRAIVTYGGTTESIFPLEDFIPTAGSETLLFGRMAIGNGAEYIRIIWDADGFSLEKKTFTLSDS